MKSADKHGTDEYLSWYVDAVRQQFDGAEIERAAQRLRESLPRVRSRLRATTPRWLTLAAAASVAFAAVTAVSLFLPGRNGSAFAQAQQRFSTFHTLHIETTAQMGQETVSTVDFWLNDTGDLRIEAGDATTIARSGADTIYTVLPDGQVMAQSIPLTAATGGATDWLEEIRSFQGQAEQLAETRLINGISAIGYALAVGSTRLVLWVDPFDAKPLLVEAGTPGGPSVRHALSFDVPLPAGAFDVPENGKR